MDIRAGPALRETKGDGKFAMSMRHTKFIIFFSVILFAVPLFAGKADLVGDVEPAAVEKPIDPPDVLEVITPSPYPLPKGRGEKIRQKITPSIPPRYKFSIEKFFKDKLASPVGIFVDKKNNEVYVVDNERNEIMIFDPEGLPLFKFDRRIGISSPIDLVVRDDRMYLVEEAKNYIEVFNLRGELLKKLSPEGVEFLPGRIDMDEQGNIYVINKAANQCMVINKEDKFGTAIGNIPAVAGVAAGEDRVYMFTVFSSGGAVHAYGKDGAHIISFESIEGTGGGGTLGLPVAGKVDGDGNLWLVDGLRGIFIYNREGKKVSGFGFSGEGGGVVGFPVDIDFDGEGMVYIVDKGRKKISVFK